MFRSCRAHFYIVRGGADIESFGTLARSLVSPKHSSVSKTDVSNVARTLGKLTESHPFDGEVVLEASNSLF